tara:strand:+ start:6446 stop:6808 length:363 start_codon:yes stop_codon:yes gene_type:complete
MNRLKQILIYSDGEPSEILIGVCHIFLLPATICVEFNALNIPLIIIAILSGVYQLYAVFSNCLRLRFYAVQIATIISSTTCVNLYLSGLLNGSRIEWIIIFLFALWNTFRIVNEKIKKEL